jgi:hypothetical protein
MMTKTKLEWKKIESFFLPTFVDELDFYYQKWINNLLSRNNFTREKREAIFRKVNLLMEE